MAYKRFDTSCLQLKPLQEREHDMTHEDIAALHCLEPMPSQDLETIAAAMVAAKKRGASVILMMGAHVIKSGMNRFVIDFIRSGYIDHLAVNGAFAIHDFELALIGATSESVARYIQEGQFGLWAETGQINTIVSEGMRQNMGIGEAIGRAIAQGSYPYKDTSILAAGFACAVPVTVHVCFGQDIIHEHPNFDPAAAGTASYWDFLTLAAAVEKLEGGVLLNIGTAVMGPEVYLKALAMARNAAHQRGRSIRHFSTAVFDIQPVGTKDFRTEPGKDQPEYYRRYWKTVLVRTVKDGGSSFYVEGDHRQTIPSLWHHLQELSR